MLKNSPVSYVPIVFVFNFFTGKDGMIVVDTTENGQSAVKVFREFWELTKKPLKAVIITHFH